MAVHWQDAVDMNAAPPGFGYNPSAWRQRIPICLLAGAGTLIAASMALFQFGLIGGVWDPIFGDGSEKVLTSDVAGTLDRWLRVPDGAFGAWGYLSEAVLGLVGGTRRWQHRPWMVVLFGIDVIPLGGVSAILVVIQATVLGEWCFLCLVTAVISLVLVYWAYDEVWASVAFMRRVWRRSRSLGVAWTVFWGGYHPVADEVAQEGR